MDGRTALGVAEGARCPQRRSKNEVAVRSGMWFRDNSVSENEEGPSVHRWYVAQR